MKYFFVIAIFLISEHALFSQMHLSREAAVDSALKNHPAVLAGSKQIEKQKAYQRSSFLLDKTDVFMEAPTGLFFTVGVQQNFSFPSVYINESRLQKGYVRLAEAEAAVSTNQIARSTELLYLDLQILKNKQLLYTKMDSLYSALYYSTEKRYSVGDAAYLEKLLEETKMLEVKNQLAQVKIELKTTEEQLRTVTGIKETSLQTDSVSAYAPFNYFADSVTADLNPTIKYFNINRDISKRNLKLQRSFMYPGFFAGYLNQGLRNSEVLYRFRFGISLPLWFPAYSARVRSARIGIDVADLQYQSALTNFYIQQSRVEGELRKNALELQFYENSGLKQAEEVIRTATKLYSVGEIGYFSYLQSLAEAMSLKIKYLNSLKAYNQAVIDLKYLRGE